MFWLGVIAGVAGAITIMALLCFWSAIQVSGREWDKEMERQKIFYPTAEGPELNPGEIAEWSIRGHWEIYKDGELVRHYPEWNENAV